MLLRFTWISLEIWYSSIDVTWCPIGNLCHSDIIRDAQIIDNRSDKGVDFSILFLGGWRPENVHAKLLTAPREIASRSTTVSTYSGEPTGMECTNFELPLEASFFHWSVWKEVKKGTVVLRFMSSPHHVGLCSLLQMWLSKILPSPSVPN